MTREQRELMIAQLQADSAALLEDAARREAVRTLHGDPPEWQAPPPPPQPPIRKTYAQPQRSAAATDAERRAEWERWCDDRIMKMFEPGAVLHDALAEAISLVRSQLRKEFSEQIGSLRADLTLQTGIARGEIAEIKKRDAA